jgi:hypothetical protein
VAADLPCQDRRAGADHRGVRPALALLLLLVLGAAAPPGAAAAACGDHATQADAQRAADTRDADGDGVFCERLPCPCLRPGPRRQAPPPRPSCTRTPRVVPIGFSATRFPAIRRHVEQALASGWPRVMVLNRPGAEARRAKLLEESDLGTFPGLDRDEYPPAIGRGRGPRWLRRGIDPVGWRASVRYVPAEENRGHGARLGVKLRRFCDGQRFRYVFF